MNAYERVAAPKLGGYSVAGVPKKAAGHHLNCCAKGQMAAVSSSIFCSSDIRKQQLRLRTSATDTRNDAQKMQDGDYFFAPIGE